jgi:two-component system, cell cycle sensor histidine kinase DivJ
VIAVMRDVTERKLQEHALVEARAQAERANAAKSRFLATMTHELRTPLNAIIGFSEMLANEEGMRLDAARRHEYSRLISDSGMHLLSVVNGVLDVSKIETGDLEINPEAFAPSQAIRNCCDLLALKARDGGIDLSTRMHDGLPELVADKRAFKQIVINLVSNALKFTDRGGSVRVGAEIDGTVLVITVKDTGVGIGPEDLTRVGQPFFQGRASYDRSHDGSGLGLSIVQGLVMLHGGHMDIASHVGEGTCVTVRLPFDCRGARPMRVKQSETISQSTFERMIEASRDLEKKRA